LAISSDHADVAVGGASAGGLSAACTALAHPEVFGNVLSESGAFWRSPRAFPEEEWLASFISKWKHEPVRFFISIGTLENDSAFGTGMISMLHANRHLRDVLLARGYDVSYLEITGAHDPLNWERALPEALRLLFGANGAKSEQRNRLE
ncbi:MAG TPA: alpha/beta hydrolase-fold protein, partial [Candidatus Angelobacter sp.]